MKLQRSLATVVTLLLLTTPLRAWNGTGHMTVAELAWRNLSSSRRVAVSNLLKQHPHYALLLVTNAPAGVDTNEWVFLKAATWPDMVRPAMPGHPPKPHDITKYHRGPWHFVNFPFILPADAASFSAASFPIESTNILSALSNALNTIHDPLAVPGDKAVSLCWVLHLVGDLHQPLHTVKLISNTYTNGDQGGNALAVAEPGHHPVKLHALWDDLLGSGESYTFIEHLANGLDAGTQYDPAKSKNYKKHKSQASWAAESVAAAQAIAYLDGQLEFADWKAFEARHLTAADVPVLTMTYILNATDAARQRVALAGRRLADTLNKAF